MESLKGVLGKILLVFFCLFPLWSLANEEIQPIGRIVEGTIEAKELTWEQKKQLFFEGKIKDDQGRIWNIKIIPGTRNIKAVFVKGWKSAGSHLVKIFDSKFYSTDVPDAFKVVASHAPKRGLEFTRDSLEFVVDLPRYFFLNGIKYDFKMMFRDNRDVLKERPIGWQAVLVWNFLQTIGTSIVRTIGTPIGMTVGLLGAVGGATYSGGSVVLGVTFAATRVIWEPIMAVLEVPSRATIVPGFMMLWNGASWVVAQTGSVPAKSSPPWVVEDQETANSEDETSPEKIQDKTQIDLLTASRAGDLEAVSAQVLSQDFNVQDANGQTPLMISVWEGHAPIARLLVQAGADLDIKDQQGWTALMAAVAKRRLELAKVLLRAGADLKIKNKDGKSALDLAEERGDEEMIQLLRSTRRRII